MNSQHLDDLVATREDWLMNRVLHYARLHNYTQYTSTLAEAWRMSIQGLSESLMRAIKEGNEPPEFGPDDDFTKDPISSFGILEAQRHRSRGVTISMFLGLMKYYRQGYIDLVMEAGFDQAHEDQYRLFIERFFDRVEIGFAAEWSTFSEDDKMKDLQSINRIMTNEKNKYLTIFESIPTPVVFLNPENTIDNMNHAASTLIYGIETPGSTYYAENKKDVPLPWKIDEIATFLSDNKTECAFEKALDTKLGVRFFQIKLKRMLDVSQKFTGLAIILNDITERKQLEDRLSIMSVTDDLTGLCNRRGFFALAQQQIKIAERTKRDMLLLYADLDHMKQINDTWGHREGDEALKDTALVLKKTFRDSDIIGRIGGDEFAVLVIDATDKAKEGPTKRLYNALEAHNGPERNGYRLSLSIGIAHYDPANPSSLDQLIAKADSLMYDKKRRKGGEC